MNSLKNEIVTYSVSLIAASSIAALTTDKKVEKIVALEEIRSRIYEMALVTNNDFSHSDIHHYENVSYDLLEMAIVTLKNIVVVLNDENISKCITNADEVYFMLDRWESANER